MKYLKAIAVLIFSATQTHSVNAIAEGLWVPDPTLNAAYTITSDIDLTTLRLTGKEVYLTRRTRGRNDEDWTVQQLRFDCENMSHYVFDNKARKWRAFADIARQMSKEIAETLIWSDSLEAIKYCKQYYPKYRALYRRYGL